MSKIESEDEGSKKELLKKSEKKSMKNIASGKNVNKNEGKGKVEKKLRFADTTAHNFAA